MAKIMNDNFQINVGNPIDAKYLASTNAPYASVSAVNTAIPQSQRYVGLTVNINNVEYWYADGVLDGNLVIKDSGVANTGLTSASNGLTKVGDTVVLGGTLTGDTTFTGSASAVLQYGGDYSSGFDANSIPSAGFVTGKTSQSVTSATNGITKTGQAIELGGTTPLNKTTNICGADFNMNIGTAASKIGDFTVNAGNAAILASGTTDICPTGVLTLDGSSVAVKTVAAYDNSKAPFTALQIPDAQWVTGLTSQAILTANNGLTKTGTVVGLGGTLTTSKTIDVGTNYLQIQGSSPQSSAWFDDNVISFNRRCLDTNCYSSAISVCATATKSQVTLAAFDLTTNCCNVVLSKDTGDFIICLRGINATHNYFCLTPTGNTLIDAINSKGIEYGGAYKSNFTPHSLVDKDYVDSAIVASGASLIGGSNGLTRVDDNITLGGALTGNTNITGAYALGLCTTTVNVNPTGAVTLNAGSTVGICPTGAITLQGSAINANTVVNYNSEKTYTALSLPSAGWVTGKTSQAILTATNGLTKTGTAVCLGGTLSNDTIINLNNGNCFQLCDNGNATSYIFDYLGVFLCSQNSLFQITNSGTDYKFKHSSGRCMDLNSSGLTYGGDYSACFKPNTLVTKAYVDSASGGILANNGITRAGCYISLGGALTGDTTISGSDSLAITSPLLACCQSFIRFEEDSANIPTTPTEGMLYYSANTLNFVREYPDVILQIGEETVIKVSNLTGNLLENGSVVYISGSDGAVPTVAKAIATDLVNAQNTIGLVTADIPDAGNGFVTLHGAVRGLNTTGLTGAAGSPVYLSTTVAGGWTSTPPSYPNEAIHIGYLIVKDGTDGEIQVAVDVETAYVNIGVFTGYTATTQTALNNKLNTTTFNSYTGTTNTRLNNIEDVTDIAITGATNGLTKIGRNAELGGALTKTTTISGSQTFTIGTANHICLATTTTKDIGINAKSNGEVYLKSQSGTLDGNVMTNAVGIELDFNAATPMLITDNTVSPRGLQYAADYTSTFCDRSLVDKYYVDSIATGLNVHAAVSVATTTNIVLSGTSGTIDGVLVSSVTGGTNRILVKNQTNAALNGIYSASTGIWGRTDDYDFTPTGEVTNGDLIPVISGDTNANSQWINVSTNPIISGDSINFSIFSQQQGVIEGNGICVTTSGSNKEVCVKLSPSNPGLCFDSTALELDYGIFTCGLDTSTVGEIRVCADLTPVVGTEIPVHIGTANALFVDSDDFSYSLASNGLTKIGSYITLGGELTGDTRICGSANSYDFCLTDLDAFCLSFASACVTANDSKGLVYAGDYKATFVDNSLVSKLFVNNAITGSTLTYNNGLTKAGKTISWGGNLTGNTSVLWGSGRVCMSDTASVSCVDLIAECTTIRATEGSAFVRSCVNAGTEARMTVTCTGTMALVATNATQGLTITSAAHGAVYAGDYESNFVARSLATAQYVTGKTSQAIQTANNGLTKVGQNVVLGGTLTGNTTINTGTNTLNLGGGATYYALTAGATNSNTTIRNVWGTLSSCYITCAFDGAAYAITCTKDSSTSQCTEVYVPEDCIRISYTNSGGTRSFRIGSSSTTFTDTLTSKGIVYAGDYTANFDNCSLVTKAYVDSAITGGTSSITGSNGITRVDDNITLGGALTGTTTITGGGVFDLNLGSNGDEIGTLTIWTSTCTSIAGNTDLATLYLGSGLVGVSSIEDTGNLTASDTAIPTSGAVLDAISSGAVTAGLGITNNTGTFDLNVTDGSPTGLDIAVCIDTGGDDVLYVDSQDIVTNIVSGIDDGGVEIPTYDNLSAQISVSSQAVVTNIVSGVAGLGSEITTYDNGNAQISVDSADIATVLGGNVEVTDVAVQTYYGDGGTWNVDQLVVSLTDIAQGIDSGGQFAGTCVIPIYYGDGLSGCNPDQLVVDAADIQAAMSGNTFGNGLTNTAGAVCLGGQLSEASTLIDLNSNTISFETGGAGLCINGDGLPTLGDLGETFNYVCFGPIDGGVFNANPLNIVTHNDNIVQDNGIHIFANTTEPVEIGGSDSGVLCLESTGNIFTDNTGNGYGIQYGADYCGTFQDDSLVSKCYVDGAISSGAVTANNGLTKTGGNITLGGALTGNTNLTGAYDLSFTHTNFNVTAAVCVTGAMDISSTLGVGGALTLDSVAAGNVGTDDVLMITSGGEVKKVAATTLGEDNNIYAMSVVTTDITLTTGSSYVQLINNASSGLTITLPATPIDGQVFRIKDAAGAALTYPITIARNGKLIDGAANDGILNTDGGALELVYNNALGSWFVFSFVN